MKKILALILALSMLVLCGCGGSNVETEPTTHPTTEVTEPITENTEATTEATEPSSQETDAAVEYRNPLTGEILSAPLTTRIISASVGNTKDAMPTRGLSQADMVFELYVNGLTTRLLGLFTDTSDVYDIGSIRSHRYHFTDISQSYDTIAISAGGSGKVLADVKASGIDYMNVDDGKNSSYAYRDKERQDSGYDGYHCLFALGAGLYDLAKQKGFSTEMDLEKDYGMRWAEDKALTEGQSANIVTVTFRLSTNRKNSVFTYNAETGLYSFEQYGMEMIDGRNSAPITFRNVFVLLADTWTDEDAYHVSQLIGSGEGYFACDGYMIPIQWHRATEDDTFTFTLADGSTLEQGVGTCYVAIAPTQSEVTAE